MRGVTGIFSIIATVDDNPLVRGTPVVIVVLRMVLIISSISESKLIRSGWLSLPSDTRKYL